MKTTINFTDYLNSCLKREPSLKSTTNLKMGLTVNAFHANASTSANGNGGKGKKHGRTKTDQLGQPDTMATTSVFGEGKLKSIEVDRRQRKKTHSEIQLKKVQSFKTLQPSTHIKSCSVYKSTLPLKQPQPQCPTSKSIQKLRKALNETNPQIPSQQLRSLIPQPQKSTLPLTNEYFLLSNDLLQTIKKMQKRHAQELNIQKEGYERREQKLVGKVLELEKKNQRCSALINQLRMRNIDVDGIWHQERLNSRTNDLIRKF